MFIAELFSTGLNQDSYKISINSYIESVKQFIDNLINPWNTPLGYISFEDIVVCFLVYSLVCLRLSCQDQIPIFNTNLL